MHETNRISEREQAVLTEDRAEAKPWAIFHFCILEHINKDKHFQERAATAVCGTDPDPHRGHNSPFMACSEIHIRSENSKSFGHALVWEPILMHA